MHFTQYYLDCLSQASYMIGDTTSGRAVVVDPRRDVGEYLSDAAAAGLTIEMVIETHLHADFLSGHLELAAATGAAIVYSNVAKTEFDIRGVAHGERHLLGDAEHDPVMLEFRHTPGHTPESLSIVVYERASDAEPYGVLTGDTLFIGDVGRPDLLASVGVTQDELATQLYDSLHQQLMTLPDTTRVYPAHGAGSACGKNLSTDTWSTIGDQRANNYALLAPDRSTFVDLVTTGQVPAPSYFAYDAALNRQLRGLLDESVPPPAMSLTALQAAVEHGAIVVDGRDADTFNARHLRGAINVGLGGRYAEFAGSIVPADVDIVLVTAPGDELEGKNRLGRIGFDRVIGYLVDIDAVLDEHPELTQQGPRLTIEQFTEVVDAGSAQIVDVRNPGEVEAGMAPGAVNVPTGQLVNRIDELDPSLPTVVYCAGGYRSSVAASLLRNHGFDDVSDLIGGYGAWAEATQPA